MLLRRAAEVIRVMRASSESTLAELAVATPGASRVFKRHGLDYCCKGGRPLAEACRARDIDPAAVIAELDREARSASEGAPNAASLSSSELVDLIVQRYHAPLRDEMPQLVAMARRVEHRHGDKEGCPHGLADHLARMERELVDHMAREEGVLFPLLCARVRATGAIGVMRREHDEHGASLAKLRELTDDFAPPAAACATWRALYLRLAQLESDLVDHIHLENNVLFVRA
jgi:regulator of cell morphogenesis and NO signaling